MSFKLKVPRNPKSDDVAEVERYLAATKLSLARIETLRVIHS
jgi:hypothetical protein